MSEQKPKRSFAKLGRFFGMSSQTSLAASEQSLDHQDHQNTQKKATSPLSVLAHEETQPDIQELPKVLQAQLNLHNAPSAHGLGRLSGTSSPRNGFTSLSPAHSATSVDLSHSHTNGTVAPLNEASTNIRSPYGSRLSSAAGVPRKSGTGIKAKLTNVSRSSSTKKNINDREIPSLSPSGSNSYLPALAAPVNNKPRFKLFEDGTHEHNLRAAKRQEKLSNMLKDLLGGKKLRNEAKSAVPNILLPTKAETKHPTLFAGLVSQIANKNAQSLASPNEDTPQEDSLKDDCRSFVQKYGLCQEVIGRGAYGVVRISHKKAEQSSGSQDEILFAVKEFKKRPNESEKKYSRRLTSEFCISSSLKHINIIDTIDLLKDAKGDYCEVMEFCLGGDLYTMIIAAGKLEYAEADCLFKQLIRGVNYMHEMGVAHRDLKPENLLLTQSGVLKITDFGNGECFRMAWEEQVHLSEGICGSSPYIAPEEFTQEQFDPRCVDIWSCGVIYMAMRTGRQLWGLADSTKDEFFEEYLVQRKNATGYDPIESLKRARCRNVIYSILDPIPERRITGKQILNSEWGREIVVCAAGNGEIEKQRHEPVLEKPQKSPESWLENVPESEADS